MKIIGLMTIVLLIGQVVVAGNLDVMKDGSAGAIGGEVRYFKLENEFGKAQLFILNQNNQGCRIPVAMLKELGIDPIQFGTNLRNVKGNDGATLTCYMSEEQFGSRLLANRIEVTSWPRP
jgi:hypothetical protein